MNTEEELQEIVGKSCLGVGAIPDYDMIMVFFPGATWAIKFEHGIITWEVMQESIH